MSAPTSADSRRSWLRCILVVGLLVGVADYAVGVGPYVALLGAPVLRVLQHPASGLLGQAAYRGGLPTAVLGTALHFGIAVGWSAAFVVAYRASPGLRAATSRAPRACVVAAVAGIGVWLTMNNVLLPLSRGRPYAVDSRLFWTILRLHVPFVGVPLVWGTRRFAPPEPAAGPSRSSALVRSSGAIRPRHARRPQQPRWRRRAVPERDTVHHHRVECVASFRRSSA